MVCRIDFPAPRRGRGRPPVGALLLALASAFAATAFAQSAPAGDPLDGLVRDSPFMPGVGGGSVASAEAGPLEFRGVVMENGVFLFSIYDQAAKESVWAKVGEKGLPFLVRSFDREKDAIVVEQQGRSLTLALQSPKTLAAATAAPGPQPPGGMLASPANVNGLPVPAQSNGGPIPQVAPSPGSDEAMRLQKIADEIRRRRNMRAPLPTPGPNPAPKP